jgi:predicted dehydrogenase
VSPHNISAMNFLRAGNLGTIGTVRAFVHYGGGPGEVTPDSEPPAGLDWDMWCGPAPLRPYNERIHPRGFRQFLDFANGQLGDWGIHWLDQILWWTEEKAPHTVFSTGNRYIRRDTTDAPDAQVATFQFETFTATWEHRLFAANNAEKTNIGCYFYGTRGTLHLGWLDGWTFYPTNSRDPIYHEDPQFHEPDQQNIPELWADFMDAIQHNRRPACDVEEGYHATSMCLLAMISMNVGRSLKWDADTGKILNDPEASKLLRRPYRAPWVYPSPG